MTELADLEHRVNRVPSSGQSSGVAVILGSFSLQSQGQAAARSRADANGLAHTGPIRTPVFRPIRMVAPA